MGAKIDLAALFVVLIATSAHAAPCETDDFEKKVTGFVAMPPDEAVRTN